MKLNKKTAYRNQLSGTVLSGRDWEAVNEKIGWPKGWQKHLEVVTWDAENKIWK